MNHCMPSGRIGPFLNRVGPCCFCLMPKQFSSDSGGEFAAKLNIKTGYRNVSGGPSAPLLYDYYYSLSATLLSVARSCSRSIQYKGLGEEFWNHPGSASG